jgi:putative transposase
MDVFRDDTDRETYLEYLSEQSVRFKVKFLVWCMMTNHVRLMAVPSEEDSLGRTFGEAHRRYTRMVNFQEKVQWHLFQERFGSCVLDERHLLAAAKYVELNPVRAGMASRP